MKKYLRKWTFTANTGESFGPYGTVYNNNYEVLSDGCL